MAEDVSQQKGVENFKLQSTKPTNELRQTQNTA